MNGCIIYDENRLRFRLSTYKRKELLYEPLKNGTVCGSLVDTSENNAVLYIYGQDLISLLALESGNLDRSYTKGRPSHPSKSTPFVTARFIHENIVIRAEARIPRIMHIQVSQISISSLCYTANCFFGLTPRLQRPPYARSCYVRVELVQYEEHHLVPVQTRLLEQVFTQRV
jgi:hypothetical protein